MTASVICNLMNKITKFKLPRQIINPEMCKILSREVARQKIGVVCATKSNLKEIAEVTRAIAESGLPKNLVLKKLPGKLGYGIFLHPKAKPILKGQIIAPYAGELMLIPQNLPEDALYAFEPLDRIRLTKEEQSQFDGKRKYHPGRFYSMQVDALKKGNFTRYINHSDKPNIVAEFFKISSNAYDLSPSPIEVVYIAGKTIKPGEQLLVSYEGDDKSYWDALDFKPIPITPQTLQLDASLKLVGLIPQSV